MAAGAERHGGTAGSHGEDRFDGGFMDRSACAGADGCGRGLCLASGCAALRIRYAQPGWFRRLGGIVALAGLNRVGEYSRSGISTFGLCVRGDSKVGEILSGSPSESSRQNGIVVLRLPNGFKGIDLYHRLREKDDMLVSPVDHPRDLRVCLHFFNTESEFDALLSRLEVYCA